MWKARLKGGIIGVVGFILSPLSWWNDAFVNLPLALGFGWVVALLYKPAFEVAVIIGYWLTNIIGMLLLHKGVQRTVNPEASLSYTKRQLFSDFAISIAYTFLIIVLIKVGIFKPLTSYFGR